jgi:hypothetical protein
MRTAAVTLAFLLLPTLCRAAVSASDSIAAVVNGDIILSSQVCAQSAEEVARLRQTLGGEDLLRAIKIVRTSALERLIDRQLYIQEYTLRGPSLIAGWTGQEKEAASKGWFGGEHGQWLNRLKCKASIRIYATLVEDYEGLNPARRDEPVSRWSGLPLPPTERPILSSPPLGREPFVLSLQWKLSEP